ncbi:TPA: phosphoglycerate dehydrogenase [bacterium]|nr:phosphoglycerate dehydrogenase [bacterium]
MKILVSDPIAKEGLDVLKSIDGIELVVKTGLKEDELIDEIKDVDYLVVRSQTKVTANVLESVNRLKIIGRAGVGVDNINMDAATKKGIIVINTPDANTISTAEHTMAMMLACSRKIPQAYSSLKSGKWERTLFVGWELYGKILGIIGLGRIGRQVAIRAQAFNMHVVGYDPFIGDDVAKNLKITLVSLDELYKKSDYITIHVPMSPETKHMISENEIEKMKDGVIIINCARGGIIDEGALYNGLSSGKIGACALDVFEKEPPIGSPLLSLDNCVFVPHLGASTKEAQENVGIEIANQIKDAIKGNIKNAVNIPQIDPELKKILDPYVKLADCLSKFAIQVVERPLKTIEIEYSGELINYELSPLTNTIVFSIFSTKFLPDGAINYVNSLYIAKERGIGVSSAKSSKKIDYQSLISLTLVTDKEKIEFLGTLLGEEEPRIVQIDKFSVEIVPEGNLLVLSHTDEPGIIGKVGTILGEAKINIGWLKLSRKEKGGDALSIWGLDEETPQDVISRIKEIPQVLKVRMAKL